MNLNPQQRQIFALRCVIAEKEFTEKKINSLQKELEFLENGSEQMQLSWERETNPSTKNSLMNQIVLTRGKVASLNVYRKNLINELKIVPARKGLNSGSLGWKAQEAKTKLIDIGIF